MSNISEYQIKFVDNKKDTIMLNRKNKELIISSEIKLARTNEGELCAIFQNPTQNNPTFSDFLQDLFGNKKPEDNSDCSIIIHDLSSFHYCTRKNGEYQIFGGGFDFKGTNQDDKIILYECINSTINLGEGNDSIKIVGADKDGFWANVENNTINTGKGNDELTITGNFNKFTNNKFKLGKGNDILRAEINPEDDKKVRTTATYDTLQNKYINNVFGSRVEGTEGKKGWFEKDIFVSTTYSANELILSGFKPQNVTTKPTPERPVIVQEKIQTPEIQNKNKTLEQPKKVTDREKHEQYQKMYQLNSFLLNITGKQEFADGVEESLNKIIDSYK